MNRYMRRPVLPGAFLICLMLALGACGSGAEQEYFYSVDVVNETDAPITVRYDYDRTWWLNDWSCEASVPVKSDRIIEWYSEAYVFERIEAEYLGKKKEYTVASPMDIVHVRVQDFP